MKPSNRVFSVEDVKTRIGADALAGDDAIFPFLTDIAPQGVWPGRRAGNNGSAFVGFTVPPEMTTPIRVFISCVARFTNTDRDIDLHSEYSADGQVEAFYAEDDVTTTYDFVAGIQRTIEVTGVFTQLGPGHRAALEVAHNVIGGSVDYRHLYIVGA